MKSSSLLKILPWLFLASAASAKPTINGSSMRSYQKAIDLANGGEKIRAAATLNCLLMPQTVSVALVNDQRSSESTESAIRHGVAVWGQRLSHCPFAYSESATPDIQVKFVSFIGSGNDVQGQVHVVREVSWSRAGSHYKVHGEILIRDNVEGRHITPEEASSVLEHELGHVLGLDDDEQSGTLMGPFMAGQPVDGPTPSEVQLVIQFRSALTDASRHLLAEELRN